MTDKQKHGHWIEKENVISWEGHFSMLEMNHTVTMMGTTYRKAVQDETD